MFRLAPVFALEVRLDSVAIDRVIAGHHASGKVPP
jgi:hypothetical protein